MTSGGWAAVIAGLAVLITVVALIFTKRSAVASERSAEAAERAAVAAEAQAEIQRQIQVAAAQPYVWVDIREDDSQGVLLDLVIGNSGASVATNVRVQIDPPLATHRQLTEAARAQRWLAGEGISSLPPGAMIRWHLGPGFDLIQSDGEQRHEITVTGDGPFGPIPQLTYVVDLANLRGQPIRPQGSLHLLTKAVEQLTKMIN
jgi:hypothetical protein